MQEYSNISYICPLYLSEGESFWTTSSIVVLLLRSVGLSTCLPNILMIAFYSWRLDSLKVMLGSCEGLLHGAINNTRGRIQRICKYWALSPSVCSLCMEKEESVDYLFHHCFFDKKGWDFLLNTFGLFACLASHVDYWLSEGGTWVEDEKKS